MTRVFYGLCGLSLILLASVAGFLVFRQSFDSAPVAVQDGLGAIAAIVWAVVTVWLVYGLVSVYMSPTQTAIVIAGVWVMAVYGSLNLLVVVLVLFTSMPLPRRLDAYMQISATLLFVSAATIALSVIWASWLEGHSGEGPERKKGGDHAGE